MNFILLRYKIKSKTELEAISQIDVLDFIGCRDYLSALFLSLKKHHFGKYTHKQFASLLGYSRSNNTIRLYLGGHRSITIKKADQIARVLEFDDDRRKYFMSLVGLVRANNVEDREYYRKNILRKKINSANSKNESLYLQYFSRWFYPVIRELIGLENQDTTPEGLKKSLNFPLRIDDIRNAIQLLKNLKLIYFSRSEKRLVQVDRILATASEVSSASLIHYHSEMLELSKQCLTEVHEDDRVINALTFKIPKSKLPEIKKYIHEFFCERLKEEERYDGDLVYQLNLQLFPLSKKNEES